MRRTIQLPQDFDAPGNLGQFSLQVIVTAANQPKYLWDANAGSYTNLTLPTKREGENSGGVGT